MKKQLIKPLLAASTFAAMLFAATPQASAISYGFYRISDNGNVNPAEQFMVDVMPVDITGVSFTFTNTGSIPCAITEIYFDDGLFGYPTVENGTDVSFVKGANPAALPNQGSALPPFVTSVSFNSESSGDAANGINPGEWVTLTFGLGGYGTYLAVIGALDNPTEDTDTITSNGKSIDEGASLRIGMHVKSIGPSAGSDSFVNNPGVPDGGSTIALLGSAMLGVGFLRRKIFKA